VLRRLLVDDTRIERDLDPFELREEELQQLESIQAVYLCRHHTEMFAEGNSRGDVDLTYHATTGDKDRIVEVLTAYREGRILEPPKESERPGSNYVIAPPSNIELN
jgi:hypothetical protein